MQLRPPQDEGSTHVLEAVTMASIMVASIAFVVTFQQPITSSDAPRAGLATRLKDVLGILNDTPVSDSAMGTNELTVGILECLQEDCSRLTGRLDRLLPEDVLYAVYLDTGEGLYPVYETRTPGGEAVTARRSIEPEWSYQFLETSQSVINPLEDPLVVYALPVLHANPVQQGGSALRILASGNRTADTAQYVLKTSASTRAVSSATEPAGAAISLFFHAGDGVALATRDVRSQTLDAGLVATGAPVSFTARILESAAGVVPLGTTISVEIPHGWNATASQPVNAADWLVLSNATDHNGTSRSSTVSARLLHAVTSGSVDFQFNATYVGDADDHYPFIASLSAGAYTRAELLVRADAHATPPDFEFPMLLSSVPRPLGAGATTTWTIAAFSPDASNLTRIEIADEDGRDVFASVVGVTGGGTWTNLGHTLLWTGSATLGQHQPFNLTFQVTSNDVAGPAVDRAPFTPSVDFGNFSGALAQQTSPGLHRGVFLPATSSYRGYDGTFTSVSETHALASDSVYRTTALPGNLNYTVGTAVGIKDAIFGSAVSVDERGVSHGDVVNLTVEAQSIIYKLGLLGFEPSVEVNVYPPWAGDTRLPILSREIFNGSLLKGAGTFLSLIDLTGDFIPDETTVGRLSTEVEVQQGWLYGPYATEVNITWLDTLGSGPLAQSVIRSAKLYDYFVVEPSGGTLPASPVYDVHLVSWLQDWG